MNREAVCGCCWPCWPRIGYLLNIKWHGRKALVHVSLRVGVETSTEYQGLQKILNESVYFKINTSWQREMKRNIYYDLDTWSNQLSFNYYINLNIYTYTHILYIHTLYSQPSVFMRDSSLRSDTKIHGYSSPLNQPSYLRVPFSQVPHSWMQHPEIQRANCTYIPLEIKVRM